MQLLTLIFTSFLSSTLASSLVDNALFARQSTNTEEQYLSEVCFPNTTNPIPPCQEITNIQEACNPNGTTSLDLLAHAECMCGGSFFSDWVGCLNCDYVHGARSPQEVDTFNSIISSASKILCTGTPTANFTAIFNSLTNLGVQGTGATGMTDQYPSNTAISLYFTASGSQGPGPITGSATGATRTSTSIPADLTPPATTSGSGGSGATGASLSGQSGSSTSSSKAGAAPTGVVMGMLGLVAGGALMVAL